jgi:hypothetical protein
MRSARWWALSIGLVLAVVALGAPRVDVPTLAGPIKGDEATYVAMAFSLAKDGDLKYRPEDYRRFVSLYRTGPEGIFLKRSHDLHWRLRAGWPPIAIERTAVPATRELDYGKPFAYAVAAAPFAAVFGLSGLLLFNLLLLAICVSGAVVFARARAGRVAGTLIGAGFVCVSVVPVYGAWMTSEIFNFTLVLVAYFLWLYKEVAPPDAPRWVRAGWTYWLAVALLGVATFSKLPNAALIGPVVLLALARRQIVRGAAVGVLFCAVVGGLFGTNALISGEANYQGGVDRSSFATHFPFDDQGTTFDSGHPMTTNQANDENILDPAFALPALRLNVPYFLFGRDSGLVPYFFPGALIALLWVVRLRHTRIWQTLIAICLAAAALGLLVLIPAGWNGAGGPIGNRYFLSLYPALLFLLPSGTGLVPAVIGVLAGAICVGPILIHPFQSKQMPWVNPERWPLHLLPVEFTLINDIPVFLNPLRGRVLVSKDPEVFLYYMDSHAYFQEPQGFWVAPGTADIVIRTANPLTRLDLRLRSPIANEIDVALDGSHAHETLRPGEEKQIRLRPGPGVKANGYQLLLRIKTAAGFYPKAFDPGSRDNRHLGVFISPTYEAK